MAVCKVQSEANLGIFRSLGHIWLFGCPYLAHVDCFYFEDDSQFIFVDMCTHMHLYSPIDLGLHNSPSFSSGPLGKLIGYSCYKVSTQVDQHK